MSEDQSIYTVYLLTDGIAEDVWDGDDFNEALAEYDRAVAHELWLKDTSTDYAETTIHLLDVATQNMLYERCVTRA